MVQIAFAIEADVRNVSSLKYMLAWFLKFPGLRRKVVGTCRCSAKISYKSGQTDCKTNEFYCLIMLNAVSGCIKNKMRL